MLNFSLKEQMNSVSKKEKTIFQMSDNLDSVLLSNIDGHRKELIKIILCYSDFTLI